MSTVTRPMYEWKHLPWRKLEKAVFKLQKRIYQASKRGDVQAQSTGYRSSCSSPGQPNVWQCDG